jgi:hypothetical protein
MTFLVGLGILFGPVPSYLLKKGLCMKIMRFFEQKELEFIGSINLALLIFLFPSVR